MNSLQDILPYVSEFDKDGYFPFECLFSFPSIQELKVDENDLLEAIQRIDSITLSPDKKSVHFSLQLPRNTIIIRDVPEVTTEESIRLALKDFVITNIKREIGNSWFISFDSEHSATSAIEFLSVNTLDGKIVKSRLKSGTLMREAIRRNQMARLSNLSVEAEPFTPKSSTTLFNQYSNGISGYDNYWNDQSFSSIK